MERGRGVCGRVYDELGINFTSRAGYEPRP